MFFKDIFNDNFCVVLVFDISFGEEDAGHVVAIVKKFVDNWIQLDQVRLCTNIMNKQDVVP